MKALLNKVLPTFKSNERPEWNNATIHPHMIHLKDAQMRCFVGFMSMKMAEMLEMHHPESAFYKAFTKCESESDMNDLNTLGNMLLEWVRMGKNVTGEIDDYLISSEVLEAFKSTYEMYKNEINIFKEYIDKPVNKPFDLDDKEWGIYRDIIYAVTQKKLLLITPSQIEELCPGDLIYQKEIKETIDVPTCRKDIQEILRNKNFKTNQMMNWLLAISEVVTNTLKHADEGFVILKQSGNDIYVIVDDYGPGFNLKDLPNMTLLAGYSTKKSLGQGFNIVLKMIDQMMISNTIKGACVILKLTLKEEEALA